MKKIFTLLLTCAFASAVSAQNFMKFDAVDGNGVKALNGIASRSGAGQMDILVPTNFDLKNVVVDYQIAANDELTTGPIPTDYSTPQAVTVKSGDKTRNWTITFKKVNPTTLPFALSFSPEFLSNSWTPATVGWAAGAIDPADNNAKAVRFGIESSTFIVALADQPEKLSYDIFSVGATAFTGTFDVYTSVNGVDWVSATKFTPEAPMATSKLQTYELDLDAKVRFIKWVYTIRTGNNNNVTMNNINITKGNGTGINDEISEASQMYVNNNELVITDSESVAKVEIFSLIGSLVYVANNPSNNTNLNGLAQGVYVAKTTTANGAVATLKFVIQ